MSVCGSLFPLGFLMVTLANQMELIGMVEGDRGVEAVKMYRVLLRAGSENDGEEVGLECVGSEGKFGSEGKQVK